jgi:hypothetical protein
MATPPLIGGGFIQDPVNSYIQYKDTHGNTLIAINRDGSVNAGTFQLVDESGLGLLLHPAEIIFADGSVQTTAPVAPAPPAPPVIQQATVTLTSAQLLALSSTPVTLIPAPGAGFYLFPQYYTMDYTFGGTAYSSPAHTNDCYFSLGAPPVTSSNEVVVYQWANAATGIIEAAASCVFYGLCGEGLIPTATANNAPLVFSAPAALTLGNGTLKITVNYSVVPV